MSEYVIPRKKRPADNFKFAMGMGLNWANLDTGKLYLIQDYVDAMNNPEIPKDKKPTKIKVVKLSNPDEVIAELSPEKCEDEMKDPDPDPRYAYVPPKHGSW